VERGFHVANGPMLGKTYVAAIVAFVPRSIWNNKPRGPDSVYVQLFLHESANGRGIPVGQTEEMYWNFGLPGIIVLSAIYGWLLRLAYFAFWRRYPNPLATVFYVTIITTFHFATEDLVRVEQQLLLLGICSVAISALTKKVRPPAFGYVFAGTPRSKPLAPLNKPAPE
jgi:hypothetical protein